MIPRTSFVFDRQRILVAGEECAAVALAIATLRSDGHRVTHAADARSAVWDAIHECHLLILAAGTARGDESDFFDELRERLPALAVLWLADDSPATQPMPGASVLHEPFTAGELRAAVLPLLPQLRVGSVLAGRVESNQAL